MPLKDLITERAFGVIHVNNKGSNDVFTASDEMLIKLFVHHLETTLSHCNVYTRTTSQLHLLESMMRATFELSSTYISPENPIKAPLNPLQPNDILKYQKLAPKPLKAPEILHALETVTHDALKLSKVRAFLVTSPFIGMTPGSLIYLTKSTCAGLTRHSSDLDITTVTINHTCSHPPTHAVTITLSYNLSQSHPSHSPSGLPCHIQHTITTTL